MRKGFTLIEVLVVAVIVAILAAVAIPAYNSYIEKTYEDIAVNTASTVVSMAVADIARGVPRATAVTDAITNVTANPEDNVVTAHVAGEDDYVVTGNAGAAVGGGTITVTHHTVAGDTKVATKTF